MFAPEVHYYIDVEFLPKEIRSQLDEDQDNVKFKFTKNKLFEFNKKESVLIWDHNPTRKMLENSYPDEDEAIKKIKEYEDLSGYYMYLADELRADAGLQDIVLDENI